MFHPDPQEQYHHELALHVPFRSSEDEELQLCCVFPDTNDFNNGGADPHFPLISSSSSSSLISDAECDGNSSDDSPDVDSFLKPEPESEAIPHPRAFHPSDQQFNLPISFEAGLISTCSNGQLLSNSSISISSSSSSAFVSPSSSASSTSSTSSASSSSTASSSSSQLSNRVQSRRGRRRQTAAPLVRPVEVFLPNSQETCYSCAECGKCYKAPHSVERHYMVAHVQRRNTCGYCGRTYSQKASATRHIKESHRGGDSTNVITS